MAKRKQPAKKKPAARPEKPAIKPASNARPGYFGRFGGQFVPETLMAALEQLEREYSAAMADKAFRRELDRCYREIAGRPSELYFARRLTEQLGGAKIYLKREDMNHTGAHKINNTLGQALLTAADGQEARHRRDRRRPARRGHGHRGGRVRPGVRRVHGHARTSAARPSTSSA